jgi:hypothetical protein
MLKKCSVAKMLVYKACGGHLTGTIKLNIGKLQSKAFFVQTLEDK